MSEEVLTRHRKELKSLEGEKRAALKKVKGTKGKKGKELLAATEQEYDLKLKELQAKHQDELASDETQKEEEPKEPEEANNKAPEVDEQEEIRKRKQEKARRKREKAKQAELDRQARIEQETKDAGPSARQIELVQIQAKLEKDGLSIVEVPSDGNCLYRAVANQCGCTYGEVRSQCANSLSEHQDDFMPFCELTESIPTFDDYVERVRNSSDWGGHLELRALSLALERPIEVYSASTEQPLVLGAEGEPIRLSYHLHYYSLGEHYNQVVKRMEGEE